jgi:hypothetical protein
MNPSCLRGIEGGCMAPGPKLQWLLMTLPALHLWQRARWKGRHPRLCLLHDVHDGCKWPAPAAKLAAGAFIMLVSS